MPGVPHAADCHAGSDWLTQECYQLLAGGIVQPHRLVLTGAAGPTKQLRLRQLPAFRHVTLASWSKLDASILCMASQHSYPKGLVLPAARPAW